MASSSTVAPTPTPTYTLNCDYETYPNSSALCNLYCQILAYQGGICIDETECPYKLQVSEDLLCDLWDEIKLANTSSLGSTQSVDYSALIGSASGTNGAVAYSDCPHINDPNSFTACSLWCDLREAAMGQICTDSPICPYENFTSPLNEELCKLWLELQGLTTNPSSPTSPSTTPTAATPSAPSSSPSASISNTPSTSQTTTDPQEEVTCPYLDEIYSAELCALWCQIQNIRYNKVCVTPCPYEGMPDGELP